MKTTTITWINRVRLPLQYVPSLLVHHTTVGGGVSTTIHTCCNALLTFCNRGERKTKKQGTFLLQQQQQQKHRVRRVVEVRLRSGGSRYKLDGSGWDDSGRYRGWKFFIVVWDGATLSGLVSKTKTRHSIDKLCSFSSFQAPADTSNIHTPKGVVDWRQNISDQSHTTHTNAHKLTKVTNIIECEFVGTSTLSCI